MTVSAKPEPFSLSPDAKRVFAGLMLGMFVASISQMIVSPAMPRIVAELGGMDHYSWVAIAAMLVAAVTTPIVGKLSDLYGRRGFYIGGLAVFMVGSIVAGFAQSFAMLIVGRAIQGFGMGTLMPLSQTIIGDLIPARQRGKYQGIMGSVFGLSSVLGPIAGGFITDHWGWRALFFVALPVGLAALFFIVRTLHLPHQRRDAKVDVAGIVLLTIGLTTSLLATSWGGTTHPWTSTTILGLFAIGFVALVAFVWVETRAEEPVLPLRLFTSSVFSWSAVATFAIAMAMFGAMIYIPVFAQGVVGVDATNSGLVLMPMMLGMIVLGIIAGAVVTRTGRYKAIMLSGVAIMAAGAWLLTRMDHTATQTQLTVAMVVFGIGPRHGGGHRLDAVLPQRRVDGRHRRPGDRDDQWPGRRHQGPPAGGGAPADGGLRQRWRHLGRIGPGPREAQGTAAGRRGRRAPRAGRATPRGLPPRPAHPRGRLHRHALHQARAAARDRARPRGPEAP